MRTENNNLIRRPKIIIYQSELDYISRCIQDFPNLETGGEIFGSYTSANNLVVSFVTGPGMMSNHQVYFFNQDETYLRAIGKELRMLHALSHQGQWHSHHSMKLTVPSCHDVETVVKAINRYHLNNFLLLIGNISENATTVNSFLFTKDFQNDYERSAFVVLPGVSPIRQSVLANNLASYFYQPKTKIPNMIGLLTTTLKEAYYKAAYDEMYWLNDKSNVVHMNALLEKLGEVFVDVKLYQKETSNEVYVLFQDKMNRIFHVCFSTGFPLESPKMKEIITKKGYENIRFQGEWNYQGSLVDETFNYIFELATAVDELKERCYE